MIRRFALPLIALACALPAVAQEARDAAPANNDIVVTGRSLQDTADALAACIARGCPPDEDIAATLAHAENQFITGNYRDARGTMLSSIRRNDNHARQFPVEVSDLYRANGRVAAHLGETRAYQMAVLNMRDTLADSLPAGDGRVLAARVEVADSRARLGYPDEAREGYIRIAADAAAANEPRIAAFAKIRLATLDLPKDKDDRRSDRERAARTALTEIAGQGAAVGADLALMAEVMLARVERDDGDLTRTQNLMARFAQGGGVRRPLLLSSQPIDLQDSAGGSSEERSGNVLSRLTAGVDDRWIDVGYWINADGRVSDYEVLRNRGGVGGWTTAVERSVKSRQYAPLAGERGIASAGFYIVERYTLTAGIESGAACTGSRLRCREPNLRVERIDLTPEDLSDQPTRAAS